MWRELNPVDNCRIDHIIVVAGVLCVTLHEGNTPEGISFLLVVLVLPYTHGYYCENVQYIHIEEYYNCVSVSNIDSAVAGTAYVL